MSQKPVEEPLSASEVSRWTSGAALPIADPVVQDAVDLQTVFRVVCWAAGPVSGVCLDASIGNLVWESDRAGGRETRQGRRV